MQKLFTIQTNLDDLLSYMDEKVVQMHVVDGKLTFKFLKFLFMLKFAKSFIHDSHPKVCWV